MKRILSIVLVLALSLMGLSGCANSSGNNEMPTTSGESNANAPEPIDVEDQVLAMDFDGLSDSRLPGFIEDTVYSELIDQLDSEDYFVENVEAKYVSKEYLDELANNKQSNVFFGYTLGELTELFQGSKYIFTLGEDGHTTVKAFEDYDDTYDQVVRNAAIGAGVILVCVTVSVVAAGVGVPAVSAVFAVSAKASVTAALSGAAISGGIAALVTGIQTGDPEKALKAAELSASEGFAIGAVGGAITGVAREAKALYGATRYATGYGELGMNSVAQIQKESKYPLDLIKQFKSMNEYNVYRNAGLKAKMVNGRTALVQDIDSSFKSLLPDGKTMATNAERAAKGYAPIDPATGKAYQLHHIGQRSDGALAVLTEEQHQGNAAILNTLGKESEIDRQAFSATRSNFWKDWARQISQG